MAKARAFCHCKQCDKDFEVTTMKPTKEIDAWVDWAEKNIDICPDCRLINQTQEADKILQDAMDEGLPALRGSQKQINWAASIRRDALAYIQADRQKLQEAYDNLPTDHQNKKAAALFVEHYDKALENIKKETESSYWIAIRTGEGLLCKIRAEIRKIEKESKEFEP